MLTITDLTSSIVPLPIDNAFIIVSSRELTSSMPYVTGEPEDDLAKPEFEGLWDKHKPYKVPKDMTGQPSLPGGTKMEKVGTASADCFFYIYYGAEPFRA